MIENVLVECTCTYLKCKYLKWGLTPIFFPFKSCIVCRSTHQTARANQFGHLMYVIMLSRCTCARSFSTLFKWVSSRNILAQRRSRECPSPFVSFLSVTEQDYCWQYPTCILCLRPAQSQKLYQNDTTMPQVTVVGENLHFLFSCEWMAQFARQITV